MNKARLCWAIVCAAIVLGADMQPPGALATGPGNKGPVAKPSGAQRPASKPPARSRAASSPAALGRGAKPLVKPRALGRSSRRSSMESANKRVAARRHRSRSGSRRSSVSSRSSRARSASRNSRLVLETRISGQEMVAKSLTMSALALSWHSLQSGNPDHLSQVGALSAIDALVNQAAIKKFESQIAKSQIAKSANRRSSPNRAGTSRRQSTTGPSASTSSPGRRAPSRRRSQSPNTKEMLNAISEIQQNVQRSSTQYSMSSHMSTELMAGYPPGVPNADIQARRQFREARTNETIASLARAKGLVEAGSSINQ